jgi:hypothetical protein
MHQGRAIKPGTDRIWLRVEKHPRVVEKIDAKIGKTPDLFSVCRQGLEKHRDIVIRIIARIAARA